MTSPSICYRPLPNATPESEAEVLAAVYSFLIERYENRKAARFVGGDEYTERGDNTDKPGAPSG
jgi:hypothetical protein